MVTREITYLLTDTFPAIVIESFLYYLWVGIYYHEPCRIDIHPDVFYPTSSINISIARHRASLVTIPLLDFVIIHWIQWIHRIQWIQPKSLGKTSLIHPEFHQHDRFRKFDRHGYAKYHLYLCKMYTHKNKSLIWYHKQLCLLVLLVFKSSCFILLVHGLNYK